MEKEEFIEQSLSYLLIAAIQQKEKANNPQSIEAFKIAMRVLHEEKQLYQEIPETVNVPLSRLKITEKKAGSIVGLAKDIYTHHGKKNEDMISFYKQKGILIHEGLHGSAFGRMSYIYRSKGTRIYLLDDMTIDVVTPYCTVDHHGFLLQNESYFSNPCKLEEITTTDYPEIFSFFHSENEESDSKQKLGNIPLNMLQLLSHIKEPFKKDYVLEYLLLPPDVDKISNFSQKIQSALWDICLSQSFRSDYGKLLADKAISLLLSIDVLPNPILLLNFIKGEPNDNYSEILNRTDEMLKILENKQIFTPEYSTPLGTINLSALFKKIIEYTKDKIL